MGLLSMCLVLAGLRAFGVSLPAAVFITPVVALLLAPLYQGLVTVLTTHRVRFRIQLPSELGDVAKACGLRSVRFGRSSGDGAGRLLNNDSTLKREGLHYAGSCRSSNRLGLEFKFYVDLPSQSPSPSERILEALETEGWTITADDFDRSRWWLENRRMPESVSKEGFRNNWISHSVTTVRIDANGVRTRTKK